MFQRYADDLIVNYRQSVIISYTLCGLVLNMQFGFSTSGSFLAAYVHHLYVFLRKRKVSDALTLDDNIGPPASLLYIM